MEIDIDKYLTESDRREIAAEEFRIFVRLKYCNEKELGRVLSNVAYNVVSGACDEVFDESLKELLAKNVRKVVEGLTDYTVFKRPDVWDRGHNDAYEYLKECVHNQYPRIKEIVEQNVETQVLQSLKEDIEEMIRTAIWNNFKACE